MRKAIIALSAFALMVVTVAVAQDKPAATITTTTTTASATADPVIITAGSIAVRQSEFETAVKSLPPEYQQYALGAGKKQFADDYLRMKLLAAEGMKSGLDQNPDVLKQLDLLKQNLVAQEELKKIDSSVTVTDADLKKAYDENKKEYEQVKARHILIAFKGSPAAQKGKKELTDAEAKAKAHDFDGALDLARRSEEIFPDFAGAAYVRFLVESEQLVIHFQRLVLSALS